MDVSTGDARRLLLHSQGLLGNPDARATPAKVLRLIHDIGFVQLDSIPVVERAQHLTLRTRLENYRPQTLKTLVEKERSLFEHWTHDASVIPVDWLPHWRHRCSRFLKSPAVRNWVRVRLAENPKKVIRETLARIEKEGPLRSRDFDPPVKGRDSGWWRWKPHKAALEYLWWSGDLCVCARDGFQKVYDLTVRTHPDHHSMETPHVETTIDQTCAEAIHRLGCATPAEIAAFYDLVTLAEARAWCKAGVERGDLIPVRVGSADPEAGAARKAAFAPRDLVPRIEKAKRALQKRDDRMRLLSPFDPVIRDRDRAHRLFGFHYRFEAYVPEKKRIHGYYVLPILQNEALVGRCDLKLHRQSKTLEVKGIWWETGIKATRRRKQLLDEALEKMADFAGASDGLVFASRR